MRLIDRYVFSLFLKVFLVCFLSLTGIYAVGDFVGNLNEFIEAADQQGSILTLLAMYYGARVPWFFDLVGRVAALVSAVFAITWLQRHNEMTALMAAGISRWRIIKPLASGRGARQPAERLSIGSGSSLHCATNCRAKCVIRMARKACRSVPITIT